jgi:putative MFS transporter
MTAREWRLIVLLGASVVVTRYAESLFGFTLVQIQEELQLADSQLAFIGSTIELGALPAVVLLVLADRLGRRKLLITCVACGSALSAATALATDVQWLVALQLVARVFLAAQFGLAIVTAVEELRPAHRGFGIGVLGTFAIVGHGLAMVAFGTVGWIPGGWRGLFALSALSLLLLPLLSRNLPETRQFEALGGAVSAWLHPVRKLVRAYPRRLAAVATVSFLWSLSNQPADFFLVKLAQDEHGMSPERFATLAVLGGLLGLSGQLVAGWFSDRSGRRPAMLGGFVLEPCAAIALYTAMTPLLPPIYVAWIFVSVANDVLGRTTSAELFPTSARATAAGVIGVIGTLGAVVGLACEGLIFNALGSHWDAVRIMALSGLAIAPIIYFAYPESSKVALEDLSPEDPQDKVGPPL